MITVCFFVFVLIRSWAMDWKELGSRCSVGGQLGCKYGVDSLRGCRSRNSLGDMGIGLVRGKRCCVHVLRCVMLWCFVCMLRCKDRGERLVYAGTCLQSYQLSSVTNEEING